MATPIVPQDTKNRRTRIGGIYQITQLSTGRKYIGASVNINARKLVHFNDLSKQAHGSSRLQKAWDASSPDDFVFEILEIVENPSLVNEREQFYLNSSVDFDFDFNVVRISGQGSVETRKSLGQAKLGKVASEATKAKMSAVQKEAWATRVISEESHKRRSDSAKEMNRKRKESGWKLSEEFKKEQSERLKNTGHTPPLGWWKGKKRPPITEETRKKQSEEQQKRKDRGWKKPAMTEETKRKRKETVQKKIEQGWKPPIQSEEQRRKNSEGGKRAWAIRKAKQNSQDKE